MPAVDEMRRVADQLRDVAVLAHNLGQRGLFVCQRQPLMDRLAKATCKQVCTGGDSREGADVGFVEHRGGFRKFPKIRRVAPLVAIRAQMVWTKRVVHNDYKIHNNLHFAQGL